jgi:hypothetical protein
VPYKPERRARGGQGGHRAHLPEHPPVRRDDGARERDGRPPCAHPVGLWARSSARRFKAEEAAIAQRAQELLDYVGIGRYADYKARTLSYGDQRRLEIARALATDPKLIALDEPAAGMNATEKVVLRELIDRIRNDGRTILLIEHDVKLVMGLCDRVTVLDYGKQIAEGTPAEVQRNDEGDRGLPRRRAGRIEMATPLLKVSGLKVAYGGIQAVKGVELRGAPGRTGQPDRRQRRRQDHHAEGHHRHAAGGRPATSSSWAAADPRARAPGTWSSRAW